MRLGIFKLCCLCCAKPLRYSPLPYSNPLLRRPPITMLSHLVFLRPIAHSNEISNRITALCQFCCCVLVEIPGSTLSLYFSLSVLCQISSHVTFAVMRYMFRFPIRLHFCHTEHVPLYASECVVRYSDWYN